VCRAKNRKPNRLIHEKSPYLLQHAHNPVDWHSWGEEAFERAKNEDKPIFLSIGYSTCHWCHVMEKESFEDMEVARLLNENFVCVKVDREERPDIDNMYMTVCQILTGRGGWPLTIIMTPDKKPFFAGTYIPKKGRFGLTGMLELVPRIREVWINNRDEILKTSEHIIGTLQKFSKDSEREELDDSIFKIGYEEFVVRFDENYGGFGGAPKFPTPHNLLFLLRYWKRTGKEKALHMVEMTLNAMCMGGIWDHVGFGFHRYSTDRFWLVPHFEKMLYDQAMLAMVYTEAFQATGKFEYKETVDRIFEYVIRDMTSPEGGFYSAEDADSEGEEGKFYLWSEKEIKEALDKDAELIIKVFNTSKEGNFVDELHGKSTGKNILHQKKHLSKYAKDFDLASQIFFERIEGAGKRLFEIREKRVHPSKDDKILTDWNGLMIAAMAIAGRTFENDIYIDSARKDADFIISNMADEKKRLYHRFRDGEALITGFLDDYAFFVWGLLELYETTFNIKYLRYALEFNQYMIEHFWDDENGGFYSTSDDGESLLVRQKVGYDGAIPSGNSVAMLNLLRLARITANSELESKASQVGLAFSKNLKTSPSSHTQFLVALDFAFGPSYEAVIVGDPNSDDTKEMVAALRRNFIPNMVVIHRPIEEDTEILSISPFIKNMMAIEEKATVFVCHDHSCELPTNDINKMLELLDAKKIG
jgi:uncharacterized protein YyaL (SSP411 family)